MNKEDRDIANILTIRWMEEQTRERLDGYLFLLILVIVIICAVVL